jgi:hypothetical protein
MFATFIGNKARKRRGDLLTSPSETSTRSSLGLSSLAFDSNAGYLLSDEAGYYMDLSSLPRGYDTLTHPRLTIMATNIQAMYVSQRVNYVLTKPFDHVLQEHEIRQNIDCIDHTAVESISMIFSFFRRVVLPQIDELETTNSAAIKQ